MMVVKGLYSEYINTVRFVDYIVSDEYNGDYKVVTTVMNTPRHLILKKSYICDNLISDIFVI